MKLRLLSLLLLCLMLSSCFSLLPPLEPLPTDENGTLSPRPPSPAISEEAPAAPRLELRGEYLYFVDEGENQWGTGLSHIRSLKASHAADQALWESDPSQIFSILFSNSPISMYAVSEKDIENLELQTGFLTVLQFGDPAIPDPLLELSLTNSGILIYRHASGVYFRSTEGVVNTRRVHRLLGW